MYTILCTACPTGDERLQIDLEQPELDLSWRLHTYRQCSRGDAARPMSKIIHCGKFARAQPSAPMLFRQSVAIELQRVSVVDRVKGRGSACRVVLSCFTERSLEAWTRFVPGRSAGALSRASRSSVEGAPTRQPVAPTGLPCCKGVARSLTPSNPRVLSGGAEAAAGG